MSEAALALSVFAAGFALIAETTWEHQAPMLERRLGPVAVTGRVLDIDLLGTRLAAHRRSRSAAGAGRRATQPRRLRIHIPTSSDLLVPGDGVAHEGGALSGAGQVLPGGHDLQREAYFAEIGGVGYSYGGARRVADARSDAAGGWREALRELRAEMTRRITAVLPGSTGGVASALITGKRGAIVGEGQGGVSQFRPVASVGDRRACIWGWSPPLCFSPCAAGWR